MNDDGENFLERWSKRKSQARTGTSGEEPRTQADESRYVGAQDAEPEQDAEQEEIALEDLPPIESIDASTDLTHWLRKRVPDGWKQAALKRVWAADPAISQFTGLAENAWDWNAPDGVPGFGPLNPADNVAQLLARVIGQMPGSGPSEAGKSVAATDGIPPSETSQPDPPQAELPKEISDASILDERITSPPQPFDSNAESAAIDERPIIKRRRGGGALPA